MCKKIRVILFTLIILSLFIAISNQIDTVLAYSKTFLLTENIVKEPATENDVAASNNEIGSLITVADTANFERSPAVAYCTGMNYLVVYESNSDHIYGQFIDLDGSLVGPAFLIYSTPLEAVTPKIACDWNAQQFIVVWTVEELISSEYNYNIMAQAVRGSYNASGSQLVGAPIYVAHENDQDELNPSVACNINFSSCLVAFEYGDFTPNNIDAQRVALGISGLTLDGDRFPVANSYAMEIQPDVVWGAGEFLVGYSQYYYSTASHWRIGYHQVYDTEQGIGVEERKNSLGSWLIAPGYAGGYYDYNQEIPSLAYNSYTQHYNATFKFKGDKLITMLFTTDTMITAPQEVMSNITENPAVAFCDGPENFKSIYSEFLIPYVSTWDAPIYGLWYAQSNDSPPFPISHWWTGVIGTYDSNFKLPTEIDITGSFASENYMVVWAIDTFTDRNIYAQLIRHISSVNLPMIIR